MVVGVLNQNVYNDILTQISNKILNDVNIVIDDNNANFKSFIRALKKLYNG